MLSTQNMVLAAMTIIVMVTLIVIVTMIAMVTITVIIPIAVFRIITVRIRACMSLPFPYPPLFGFLFIALRSGFIYFPGMPHICIDVRTYSLIFEYCLQIFIETCKFSDSRRRTRRSS